MALGLAMGSLLGGIGSGLLGGLGSFFGGQATANSSEKIARQNTQAQLDWEREKFNKEIELANTAHQREVEDLEKAGLNKILTVGNGGAITPTAGSISPSMPDTNGRGKAIEGLFNILSGTINSAQTMARRQGEIDAIKAEAENKKADSALKMQITISEAERKGLIQAQTAHALCQANLAQHQYELGQRWDNLTRSSEILRNGAAPIMTGWGIYKAMKYLRKIPGLESKVKDFEKNLPREIRALERMGDEWANLTTGEIKKLR